MGYIRISWQRGSVAAATLCLVGCAVGPDYHKPKVQIPESFKEGVDWQRAQANPQGSLSNTWWLDYHDEQLTKLVEDALKANQSIIAAEAAYRVAQATVSASAAALYPTVSASVSGTRADYGSAAAAARAKGGVPDDQLVGDVAGAAAHLRGLTSANGKVGVIGYCSGGRQSVLAACSLPLDAAVDCYGAFVVGTPPEGMPLKVGPIKHLIKDLSCPLLGLFGADDQYPSPEQVAELEQELKAQGKTYDFHSYEGAGHAFFSVNRTAYRPEAAMDGWDRIWTWFNRYLTA